MHCSRGEDVSNVRIADEDANACHRLRNRLSVAAANDEIPQRLTSSPLDVIPEEIPFVVPYVLPISLDKRRRLYKPL
jgi:hypothetical protein